MMSSLRAIGLLAASAWLACSLSQTAFGQTTEVPASDGAPATAEAQPAAPAASAPSATAAAPTGQGPTGNFAGLSKNSDQPIDIESDVLYVHDQQKTATFKGNVKAVQGTTTLRSKELEVHYAGGGSEALTGSKAPGEATGTAPTPQPAQPVQPAAGVALGDSSTKITKIYAKGDVIITSEQDQTTTSDWADYDVPKQMVTVGGNVVLTQGKNVLKGDRLVIDLQTGESRFDNTGSPTTGKQRIKALFMPKQDDKAESGDEAKDGKAGEKHDNAKTDDKAAGEAQPQEAGGEKSAEAPAKEAPAVPDDSPFQLVPGHVQ
jgi:lipopolysaccharide export system protein LptA